MSTSGVTLTLDDVTVTGDTITDANATTSIIKIDSADTLTLSGVTISGGTINNGTVAGASAAPSMSAAPARSATPV